MKPHCFHSECLPKTFLFFSSSGTDRLEQCASLSSQGMCPGKWPTRKEAKRTGAKQKKVDTYWCPKSCGKCNAGATAAADEDAPSPPGNESPPALSTWTSSPPPPKPAAPADGQQGCTGDQCDMNRELLALVNKLRQQYGIESQLCLNNKLISAAKAHSDDMYEHKNYDHTGTDGSSEGVRATRAGFVWGLIKENIADLPDVTSTQAFNQWKASGTPTAGHLGNMLDARLNFMGAYKTGGYWTLLTAHSYVEKCNN